MGPGLEGVATEGGISRGSSEKKRVNWCKRVAGMYVGDADREILKIILKGEKREKGAPTKNRSYLLLKVPKQMFKINSIHTLQKQTGDHAK